MFDGTGATVNWWPRGFFAGAAVVAACALTGGAAVGATLGAAPRGAAPVPASSPSSTAAADAPLWEASGPYPSAFDLRDEGRVSPVRQQDNFSTCWIQSAVASLESSLLPGKAWDFSENNLANHMASTLIYEGHGDNRLAAAYFTRWDGPVLERSDPYPRKGRSPEGLKPVVHVRDILFLPDRTGPLDNDALKWAVSTVGGASCAMTFDPARLDTSTWGYRSTEPGLFHNHYVTVVGWDDDFPATSFLTDAPGDGAFLIKNSWGTDWGDHGYFWLSYYDANFGEDMAVFGAAGDPGEYDAIYQHDPLGWSDSVAAGDAASDTAWFAARYCAVGTGLVKAVGFYAPVAGSTFEVRVASSLEGIASAAPAAAGNAPVAGYHTVGLTSPAPVADGEVFVVAVRIMTPGCFAPVAIEAPSRLIAPVSAPGQSYVSGDGVRWDDLTSLLGLGKADVCLKAFVDAEGDADQLPPVVEVSASPVRRGATARVRYRVADPAFSSASVTVRLSVLTPRGTTAFSTRVPSVQVGQTGEWTFHCDLPHGTYTVTGRAYDAAGHKQAVVSRAALKVAASAAPAALAQRR